MDILTHACYGAALCSRSGLAGGKQGFVGRRWYQDRTLWLAVFFSLLPDMVSMWVPYVATAGWRDVGGFFSGYDGGWLTVYRTVHSLIPAAAATAFVAICFRRLLLPVFAWPVHILCDAISHDADGKFGTMLFYPLSRYQVDGIAFWRHGWFMLSYWAVLAGLVVFMIIWRHVNRQRRHD